MATMTEAPAATLTYEAYMAEPETEGRYDIINGVRVVILGATWDHQMIALNVVDLLRQYARAVKRWLLMGLLLGCSAVNKRERTERISQCVLVIRFLVCACFFLLWRWRSMLYQSPVNPYRLQASLCR